MKQDSVRLTWKCAKCDNVVVSYSFLRHDMDYCECGESAVDLEKHYQRNMGNIKEISREVFVDEKWAEVK